MIQITTERMAKILGVPTPEAFEERIADTFGEVYSGAYDAALGEEYTEEEAQERAMRAEQKERDAAVASYCATLVHVFEQEAEHIAIEVEELRTRPGVYRLTPKESWTASAAKVRTIVHGIGGWWFPSFAEFLSAGPYTPRGAVEKHLGYLGEVWKLYGHAAPTRRAHA